MVVTSLHVLAETLSVDTAGGWTKVLDPYLWASHCAGGELEDAVAAAEGGAVRDVGSQPGQRLGGGLPRGRSFRRVRAVGLLGLDLRRRRHLPSELLAAIEVDLRAVTVHRDGLPRARRFPDGTLCRGSPPPGRSPISPCWRTPRSPAESAPPAGAPGRSHRPHPDRSSRTSATLDVAHGRHPPMVPAAGAPPAAIAARSRTRRAARRAGRSR